MKRLSFVLLAWLLASIPSLNAQTVIDEPIICFSNSFCKIQQIELTKENIILKVRLHHRPNYWVRIVSSSYLQDADNSEIKYKIIKAEGFSLDEEVYMPQSGECFGTIYFEPLQEGTQSVHWIESTDNPEDNTYDISLTAPKAFAAKALLGDWYASDGSGKLQLRMTNDWLIYDNVVWEYTYISKKGKEYRFELQNNGISKVLYATAQKDGSMIVKNDKKEKGVKLISYPLYKQTADEHSYQPQQYTGEEKMFNAGTAYIMGHIEHYTPLLGQKYITINSYKHSKDETVKTLISIEEDGTFSGNIPLDYAQYIFMDFPMTSFFLIPNDTLFISADLEKYYQYLTIFKRTPETKYAQFMGNSEAVLINQLGDSLGNLLYGDDKMPYKRQEAMMEAGNNGAEAVEAYKNEQIKILRRAIDSSGFVMRELPLSTMGKDIITTNVIAEVMMYLLEMEMNHDFEDTEKIGYYDFVESLSPYLFDNPLTLFSNQTWVIFNRCEFSSIFRPINNYRYLTYLSKYCQQAANTLIEEGGKTIPDSTATALRDCATNLIVINGNSNVQLEELLQKMYMLAQQKIESSDEELYKETFDYYKKQYNLDNNFMYQICLLRYVFKKVSNMDKANQQQLLDKFASEIATIMPYITSPLLRRCMVNDFRNVIKKEEGNGEASVNPESEALFKRIIAPYAGNVLYLDFWGLGCGPCRAGMLNQRESVEKFKDHNIKVLYICDESGSPIKETEEFLTSNNIKGEHIRLTADEWKLISLKFGITGIPHGVVVDKNGEVITNKVPLFIEEDLFELEKK